MVDGHRAPGLHNGLRFVLGLVLGVEHVAQLRRLRRHGGEERPKARTPRARTPRARAPRARAPGARAAVPSARIWPRTRACV